jgi:hypothetical protein
MMRTGCCIHCIHARCLWCAQVSCFGQRGEGDEGDDFMLKVRLSGAVRTMDRLRRTTAVVLCCSLTACSCAPVGHRIPWLLASARGVVPLRADRHKCGAQPSLAEQADWDGKRVALDMSKHVATHCNTCCNTLQHMLQHRWLKRATGTARSTWR